MQTSYFLYLVIRLLTKECTLHLTMLLDLLVLDMFRHKIFVCVGSFHVGTYTHICHHLHSPIILTCCSNCVSRLKPRLLISSFHRRFLRYGWVKSDFQLASRLKTPSTGLCACLLLFCLHIADMLVTKLHKFGDSNGWTLATDHKEMEIIENTLAEDLATSSKYVKDGDFNQIIQGQKSTLQLNNKIANRELRM